MASSDEGVVLDLPVAIPRAEVLRLLGYPKAKNPSPRVLDRLEALQPLASSLARPRGAFVLANQADAHAVGMPSPSANVAFGVCTIGSALEDQERRLGEEGDALGALILDAFGSAAAEAAAESLHARVCAAVQSMRLRAARRISPGYGKWELRCQTDLLARLPTAQVGVLLTESSMMIPKKSVSFAVVLAPPGQALSRSRCQACDLENCKYRRQDDEGKEST